MLFGPNEGASRSLFRSYAFPLNPTKAPHTCREMTNLSRLWLLRPFVKRDQKCRPYRPYELLPIKVARLAPYIQGNTDLMHRQWVQARFPIEVKIPKNSDIQDVLG